MKEILAALEGMGHPGAFCARQTAPAKDLRISIQGLPGSSGELKWPLSGRAVKALIRVARPARFGWKDQTLLDRGVRDAWEIPKSRVKIDKRTWNRTLNPLLEELRRRLGLPEDGRLKTYLHNLLVYEPGQFFRPHQDSEKLDGMVATLVVVLPSPYRGGTLVVDHHGEKKRFQAPRKAGGPLSLIAFYADCHHEIKPVTAGYRVALTYNLVLEGAGGRTPALALDPRGLDGLGKALNQYFSPPAAGGTTDRAGALEGSGSARTRPRKLVYLLDHQYTKKGLHWQRLKGTDQMRVDALKTAARDLGLKAHLALAEIQETWHCELELDTWGLRHPGGYGAAGFEEDDEHGTDEDEGVMVPGHYVFHDLLERGVSIEHCLDANNRRVDCSGLHISGAELCWTRATDEFNPFASEYEGYMGNYGNTLDRWYHRAAVILWREADHDAVICDTDPHAVIRSIHDMAKKQKTLEQARTRLKAVLPYWKYRGGQDATPRVAGVALKLAARIQAPDSARALLEPLGLSAVRPGTAKSLAALERAFGTSWCLKLLETWSKGLAGGARWMARSELVSGLPRVIEALAAESGPASPLTGWLLDYQFEWIRERDKSSRKHDAIVDVRREEDERVRAITDLLTACRAGGDRDRHDRVLGHVMEDPVLYSGYGLWDLVRRVSKESGDALLEEWGYTALLEEAIKRFEERVNRGERKPDDWSMDIESPCNCRDCGELNRFLQSRNRRTLEWPIKKERRRHIHATIDGLGVPVTHTTRRQGSPYTLVLSKTDMLFELDRKAVESARQTLAELRRFCAEHAR